VICASDVAWNFLWQRQHQLISRFPKDWQILYIEPSFWKAIALRIINAYSRIHVPNNNTNNIIVKSIPTIPLFDRSRICRQINDRIIIHMMRSLARRQGLNNPLLILYNPRFSCLVGKLDESLTCYEINDEKLQFDAIPSWLETNHTLLIRKVNFITVSGTILYKRISTQRHSDVFLVGNGADTSHFKTAMLDIEIPGDIQRIKPPILGFIGAIGEWFDFALLESILQKYPDVAVVLIGWVFNKQRSTLERLSRTYANLFFLGRRSYDRLPNYVKAFAACIIPFRVYKLTEAVNPTKLYEYLAAGKPVVSTKLPELESNDQVIYLAKNHNEFLEFIGKALKTKHDPAKFFEIAYNNDWQHKALEMIDVIEKYRRDTSKK
jgi:glycosyltransferase involved in cell wall biosynthesis